MNRDWNVRHLFSTACFLLIVTLAAPAVLAQGKAGATDATAPPDETKPRGQAATAPAIEVIPSEAERITRLQRAIEDSEHGLKELRATIADPKSEYATAEAEFKKIDERLEAEKKRLADAEKEVRTQDIESLKAGIGEIEKLRKLARDRFDLAIQERKTIQEQAANLQQKLEQDKEALATLLAPAETRPAGHQVAATAPASPSVKPAAGPTGAPSAAAPGPMPATAPPAKEQKASAGDNAKSAEKPPSKELLKAKEQLQAMQQESQAAEEQVRSVGERIAQLEKAIAAQKRLVDTARAKVQNAQETERSLTELVQRQSADGTSVQARQATWAEIRDARQRQQEAEQQVEEQLGRLETLREELAQLQADQIRAMSEAETKREELAASQKRIERIQNPFSPRNLLQWAIDKGPKALGIIVGVVSLLWLVRFLTRRITTLIANRAAHGSMLDREQRAKTLAQVFHSTANTVVIVGGGIMTLDALGVPVAPLLGGAAVVGLAVAFGAQNLIRDYFSGFIILLENQYTVNDVVKIGGIGGLVERITLRITVLRDLEGVAHFIPNGQIATVSNMTHVWSRALFTIGVAYREDVDQVMDVLMQLAREARRDSMLGPLILADAEMLGVDAFDDSAVVVKFFIKTRPLQQWTVKRELLRRIKKRFDELGIEIPFPHRTVYHRFENDAGPGIETGGLHRNASSRPAGQE